MVLYETVVIKRFIQLPRSKFHDIKMKPNTKFFIIYLQMRKWEDIVLKPKVLTEAECKLSKIYSASPQSITDGKVTGLFIYKFMKNL